MLALSAHDMKMICKYILLHTCTYSNDKDIFCFCFCFVFCFVLFYLFYFFPYRDLTVVPGLFRYKTTLSTFPACVEMYAKLILGKEKHILKPLVGFGYIAKVMKKWDIVGSSSCADLNLKGGGTLALTYIFGKSTHRFICDFTNTMKQVRKFNTSLNHMCKII